MRRPIAFICLLLLVCSLFAGCGNKKEEEAGAGYEIYYSNTESTKVVKVSYRPQSKISEDLVNELLMQLATPPKESDTKVTKPENVAIKKAELDDQHMLTLYFSEEYESMDRITEVLCRTAYVRTLTQIPGVDQVQFMVGDAPLTDAFGKEIGWMKSEDFIDNTDQEIGAYEIGTLKIYYASKEGNVLVPTEVEAVLGTSVSKEKIILDKLISGPDSSLHGVYATIPENTKLLGVSTDDGVCYVNLSEDFLTPRPNVTELVTLYSIVNSLCELPTVDQVQFSINGNTDKSYIEDINFSVPFKKNMTYVGTDQKK